MTLRRTPGGQEFGTFGSTYSKGFSNREGFGFCGALMSSASKTSYVVVYGRHYTRGHGPEADRQVILNFEGPDA